MGELGELLRATREAKGVSLAEVEEATKIREKYLAALEAEEFDVLPGEVYVRGFLRNYAIYLGLDPNDVLALRGYPTSEVEEHRPTLAEPLSEPLVRVTSRSVLPGLLIGLLLLAILGVAGWLGYDWYRTRLQALSTPSEPVSGKMVLPTPSPTPTEVPTTTPQLPTATSTLIPTHTMTPTPKPTATPRLVRLKVEVTDKTWARVTVDGEMSFEGFLKAGEVVTWVGNESILFHCGNAGGVTVTVNGKVIGRLGEPGEVVDREWTVH